MADIAVLSHKDVAAELSILGEWAKERGHQITRYYREDPWQVSDVDKHEVVMVFGSPNSVATNYIHPTAAKEIELAKKRIDENKPFFGICYGAQVMARALGGEVERRVEKNTGYKKIDSAKGFDAGGWALWHEDFISPKSLADKKEVEILATDANAAIAFKTGKALAVQFHPEVDGDALGRMIDSIGVPESKWGPEAKAMKDDDLEHRKRAYALFDSVVNS